MNLYRASVIAQANQSAAWGGTILKKAHFGFWLSENNFWCYFDHIAIIIELNYNKKFRE
jgi:hypothetical protein